MKYDPLNSPSILRGIFAFLPSSPQVQAPQEVPLSNQLLEAYGAGAATAEPNFQLNQALQPQYGNLSLQDLQQQLFGTPATRATPATTETVQVPQFGAQGRFRGFMPQTTQIPGRPGTLAQPGTLQLGQQAQNYLIGSNLGDVAQFGQQSTQDYLKANPYLQGSLNQLQASLDSPILGTLNQQAQSQLETGGNLTPEQANYYDQQALAQAQNAGLQNTGQAVGAELLNQDQYSQARLAQAQQLGETVQGLNVSEPAQASQIFQQTLPDPYQTILGRPSGAGIFGGTTSNPVSSGVGAGTAIGLGNELFGQNQAYAQNFFDTQFNANAAANIANANAAAAQQAGEIGLLGAGASSSGAVIGGLAAGGVFSDKKIKENIKKVGKTEDGIGIYEFNYKGSKKKFRGPIAQDVEKKKPWAVKEVGGVKMVDMDKAKVPFQRWDFIGKVA